MFLLNGRARIGMQDFDSRGSHFSPSQYSGSEKSSRFWSILLYYTERTSFIRSAAKSSSICARSLRGAGWQIIERDCNAPGASGAKRKNFHPPAASRGLLVPTEWRWKLERFCSCNYLLRMDHRGLTETCQLRDHLHLWELRLRRWVHYYLI